MPELDEVVGEFLVESHDSLNQLDQDLLALEADPGSAGTLDAVFRTVHTIKGTCGFLGFPALERLAHASEHLLGRLREGRVALTGEVASALLETVDAIRSLLATIEATGSEGEDGHAELVAGLHRLAGDGQAPRRRLGDLLVEQGVVTAEQVRQAAERQQRGDGRRIGEILVERHNVPAELVQRALRAQAEGSDAGARSVRVGVDLLDELVDLVGELAAARDRLAGLSERRRGGELAAASQEVDRVTRALEAAVGSARAQPVSQLWRRFPRLVRDLAHACGKQVRVELEGGDTELDRTVLEAVRDPLTHLVRNAVDHGIEAPALRTAAGKAAEGRLRLRAATGDGWTEVEVTDDGAGIDRERVAAKAVAAGVLSAAQAAAMSRRDVLELIFAPGLSTAASVTSVSGRGVGLDVVKTNVEGVGGRIEVHTARGRGTRFRVLIPAERSA